MTRDNLHGAGKTVRPLLGAFDACPAVDLSRCGESFSHLQKLWDFGVRH